MYNLKPCPFCGGVAESGVEFYGLQYGTEVKLKVVARCKKKCCERSKIFNATRKLPLVSLKEYTDAFESVVEDWNRRANDD